MQQPASSTNDNTIAEQACSWLARLNAGELDGAEQAALMEWLAQDPRHRREFEHIAGLWQEMEPLRQRSAVRAELQASRSVRKPVFMMRRAAFACAALAALSWFALQFATPPTGAPREYRTARGELRTITLEDGSRIELDAESAVSLETGANDYRIRLDHGNAFFTVVHRPERSFEVRVAHGLIRDIGTRFGVSADGAVPTVDVLDGEVEVSNSRWSLAPFGAVRRLVAGQRAGLAHDGGIEQIAGNPADQHAWRGGVLVFNRTPLAEAVRRFRRYHADPIAVDDEAGALLVSGTFKAGDLPAFLWGIQQIHPLVVDRRDGRIRIAALQPIHPAR